MNSVTVTTLHHSGIWAGRGELMSVVVEKRGDLVSGYFLRSSSQIELKKRTTYRAVFSKLVARVMKSTPPDQNISNRMISILYDFCNLSSVYGHGWMAGWHRLLICVFTNVFHRNESSRICFQLWFSLMRDNPRKRFQNFLQSGLACDRSDRNPPIRAP